VALAIAPLGCGIYLTSAKLFRDLAIVPAPICVRKLLEAAGVMIMIVVGD